MDIRFNGSNWSRVNVFTDAAEVEGVADAAAVEDAAANVKCYSQADGESLTFHLDEDCDVHVGYANYE